MNDLPDAKTVAFPQVVRNLKPRQWPTIAMRLCLFCAGMGCLLAIAGTLSGFPHNLVVLLYAPATLGIVCAVAFAIALLVSRPIDKVLLGEVLETWPDKSRYRVSDVLQIEFVSGPEEDYAEMTVRRPVREVRITLRALFRFRPMRLTISDTDAARLSEWATRHGIRLIGAVVSGD